MPAKKPTTTEQTPQELLIDTINKIQSYKRPNGANALKALEQLQGDNEEYYINLGEAIEALNEYSECTREDFDSQEEYSEERESLWEQFVQSLDEIIFDEDQFNKDFDSIEESLSSK